MGLVTSLFVLANPLVLLAGPPAWVQLGLLVVGGPVFAVMGASLFPLGTQGAEAAGVSHITVTGLMGAVWAAGFTLVPLLLGAVAQASSPAVAFAALGGAVPALDGGAGVVRATALGMCPVRA